MQEKVKNKQKEARKNRVKSIEKQEKGITLIALVITIIVLLILAGVTIATLTGDNGILTKASEAKLETRGGAVQEVRDLWKAEVNVDNELNNTETKTLSMVLDELISQNLITSDERKEIEENGQVTIGSRTIVFFEKSILDEINIGDYVDYQYDETDKYIVSSSDNGGSNYNEAGIVQEKLNWRVLNIDRNNQSVDLISDKPTSNYVYLGSTGGYSNGVNLLNDICAKQYSNKQLGITARSINIEDINLKLNEEGLKQRDEYVSYLGVKYGDSYTYIFTDSDAYYPKIYAQEIGANIDGGVAQTEGLGQSESPTERIDGKLKVGENGITITQTYYYLEDQEKCFCENEYELLFSSGTDYWVASRIATCGYKGTGVSSNTAQWGIAKIGWEKNRAWLVGLPNNGSNDYAYLRPIVTVSASLFTNKQDDVWNLNYDN